jgi:hypothetical protein
MRFEVPQFIEVEDKIIGPFTWKQFIYLAGGAGFLIIMYLLIPSFLLFIIVGLPVAALAGFLTFHRVNNRPFSIFLESVVAYFTRSKLYLWRREHEQTIVSRDVKEVEVANPIEHTQKKHLSSLARKLSLNTLNK